MDHGASSSSMATCKISMLWNWYTIDACFLSPSWQITSHGAFAATCIGVMLMVVLLEFLRRLGKEYDQHISRQFAARVGVIVNAGSSPSSASASAPAAARCSSSARDGGGEPTVVTFRASPLEQFIRAVIHAATFGLAYIIMLLAMYYNGYIIICILIGALLGKFLCDWMTCKVVIGQPGADAKGSAAAAGIDEPTVCCG